MQYLAIIAISAILAAMSAAQFVNIDDDKEK